MKQKNQAKLRGIDKNSDDNEDNSDDNNINKNDENNNDTDNHNSSNKQCNSSVNTDKKLEVHFTSFSFHIDVSLVK